MLNMIKMDLYRMFRTKSMYIVWIVLAVAVLFTTFLCKTDYDSLNKEDAAQQEQFTEPTAENINVGMMVTLPTEPGKKVTVYDIFYANSQGKFYALFLVIFAVLFSTADIGSGYIKNIGGQVQKRGALIFSRSIALAVFMALTMTGAFILQAVANYIVFGDLEWGDPKAACSYFLTELVLHYALVLICMAIAIVLKNNVISMVISICLTMNVMSIVYGLVNSAVRKMGIHNFQMYKYTITGKISLLPMNPGENDCFFCTWRGMCIHYYNGICKQCCFSKEGYLTDVYHNRDTGRNYYFTINYYVEISAAGERYLPPVGVPYET